MDIEVNFSKPGKVAVEEIAKADVVAIIMTKEWEKEPLMLKELQIAKEKHQKIAVAVFDGVDAKKYLEGADVLIVKQCTRETAEEDLRAVAAVIKTECYAQRQSEAGKHV